MATAMTTTFAQRSIGIPKIKIQHNGQVTFPESLVEKYHFQAGDTFHIHDIGGVLLFIPHKVMQDRKLRKKLSEWIWDKMEEEASEAIKQGEVSGPFDTAEDVIIHLRKQKA